MSETETMPAALLPEERKAATLEDVWAVIREIAERQKENDQWLKKYREENDQWLKEYREENQRWVKETNKKFGDMTASVYNSLCKC
jgi:vacuolar-type H+-ATPase subunit H